MGTRSKILLLFFAIGVVPVVALSVVNYRNGVRGIETRLRGEVEHEAQGIARDVNTRLREREDALVALARSPAIRDYVRSEGKPQSIITASSYQPQPGKSATTLVNLSSQPASTNELIPKEVEGEVRAVIQSGQKYYLAIACLAVNRQPLFRAELNKSGDAQPVRFQTREFLLRRPQIGRACLDGRGTDAFALGHQTSARSCATRFPSSLEDEGASSTRAARSLLSYGSKPCSTMRPVMSSSTSQASSESVSRLVVMLDRAAMLFTTRMRAQVSADHGAHVAFLQADCGCDGRRPKRLAILRITGW